MSNADAQRFADLVEPHLGVLFRTAYRLTHNQADAEDLVQDTCIRAFVRVAELRGSQPVKAWLLRVLHNLFVDGVRRERRSPSASSFSDLAERADSIESSAWPGPSPEESACTAQVEEQLHRAWLKLERGHRALLALRAEGYTLAEITDITGVAIDVLTARLYRARQSLARHLKDRHEPAPVTRMEIAR
jgi:RNA polymerase sigma-70 factor, ECF subfamily